jgi:hypothetical protein
VREETAVIALLLRLLVAVVLVQQEVLPVLSAVLVVMELLPQ